MGTQMSFGVCFVQGQRITDMRAFDVMFVCWGVVCLFPC